MTDKIKQYEGLKWEIEHRIELYKSDLEEVKEFINFKKNLTVNDDDSILLKIAKYFIIYELESEVIKKIKDIPVFLDNNGNYRVTSKEDIKNLIEFMSNDSFLLFFEEKNKKNIVKEFSLMPCLNIFDDEETEEERKARDKLEQERNKKLDKINKELKEFQTISKMLKFILDCQKRKSSPRARKIPIKNYGTK